MAVIFFATGFSNFNFLYLSSSVAKFFLYFLSAGDFTIEPQGGQLIFGALFCDLLQNGNPGK
jgi:hypothetical protein